MKNTLRILAVTLFLCVIWCSSILAEKGGKPGQPSPFAVLSAYCSGSGLSAGYRRYCLDVTEFNTAQDYLTVVDAVAGEVEFKKAGFYRIHFYSTSGAPIQWAFHKRPAGTSDDVVFFAGITQDHQNTSAPNVIWVFDVGDVFWLDFDTIYLVDAWVEDPPIALFAPFNHRMQISYLGPLPTQ